jgi:hypothetical protein
MNTSTQRMFMSLRRIFIVVTDKCTGFKFWDFRVVAQKTHINSRRKKVQSTTQRKIHRKPAQFFENSAKLCEIILF